ncbi:hypothetical protein K466DRAFT_587021 [Polyporus arcularius HHB13444]|uniref:Uncharacterized protein n=1 Tax=Polyporus arcularius HHB13444 TaxID=1314778 RepID=A0A5C3PDL4_9APHY|nr:hypothetical protein K466DRAFT_587021 [Polyporus arcularius HHB13444]
MSSYSGRPSLFGLSAMARLVLVICFRVRVFSLAKSLVHCNSMLEPRTDHASEVRVAATAAFVTAASP